MLSESEMDKWASGIDHIGLNASKDASLFVEVFAAGDQIFLFIQIRWGP